MKEKHEKPTVIGGLSRGAKYTKQMMSDPEGIRILLIFLYSFIWIYVLMPVSCMKLNETFPGTGTGSFVALGMIIAYLVSFCFFGRILRKGQRLKRMERLKKKAKKRPSVRVTIIRRETRITRTTRRR